MSRLISVIALLGLSAVVNADATMTQVSGYIGCHKRTYEARQVVDASFDVNGSPDYIAITEVFPDTPEPVSYNYRIYSGREVIYQRSSTSTGFGPATYFISFKNSTPAKIRIVSEDKNKSVLIGGVRGVTRAELNSLLAGDSFRIMGLVPPGATTEEQDEWVKMLAEKLPEVPRYGIGKGFSSEISFANSPPEHVRAQVGKCERWARQHDMPAMLGLVTWWGGTPGNQPDGLGGKFGDVKYQQVCYCPDFEHPENPELKALLGDRYNPHYGLSVPNQWSSTPWLTMNSDLLNEYRYKRLGEVISVIAQASGSSWINCLYLENEPRYWDTHCEEGNSKSGRQGKELWADFNPMTVSDAKEDGVNLDPTDGLSNEELSWLHRNVGKYNQEMVDVTLGFFKEHMPDYNKPLYTHSLQHKDMFPGGPIKHSAAEWACAVGARSGIEGLWTQPSDFVRLREWDKWANINREENDGRDMEEHLWDLRVTYMMGSDLYNSYNWHAIGAQRFFDYVNEFLAELPLTESTAAAFEIIDDSSAWLRTRADLQAFDHLVIPVNLKAFGDRAIMRISDSNGRLIGYGECELSAQFGAAELCFEFANFVESNYRSECKIDVEILDSLGRRVPKAVSLREASADRLKLSLDLRTQRALSLWIMAD